MISAATCITVAFVLSVYAYWKGRTAWHWFVLSVCAFGVVWLATILTLDLSGVRINLESRKLALFAGALTGIIILIVLVSVPQRPRRHVVPMRREHPR
jgi:4-hydroxybenzoate polyprenyltransferase